MRIGFTGTREGMTLDQHAALGMVLAEHFDKNNMNHYHHGDCVGADTQFHRTLMTFKRMELPVMTHGHPCNIPPARAHNNFDILHEPMEPLDRNRVIVARCELLVAAPKEFTEQRRSGTWATVRYAREANKPLVIVFPNGSSVAEEPSQGSLF